MIHLRAIATIALCEARLLGRSWAFRLSFGFAVFVLFMYNLLMSAPGVHAPHVFVALAGTIPLGNVKLLNLYLGMIAAFLATEFVKRDRQQDTVETVFVHSFTNLDYAAGKVLGVAVLFAGLELVVLTAAAAVHGFVAPSPFSWQPYALAALAAGLPTLAFTVGLAVLLVSVVRSQAVVVVVVVGLGMLSLTVLGYRYHYFFDTFAFHIPLMWSDLMGVGNGEQLLMVRGTHLLFGVACAAAAPLLSRRLPQSRLANAAAALVAVACLGGAVWTGTRYWQGRAADAEYRQQLRQLSRSAAEEAAPAVSACRLQVEHRGERLRVVAELTATNPNAAALDTLVFTLNPGLQLEQVAAGETVLAVDREEHLVRVVPPAALAPGDTCRVRMVYAGSIDERFCYLDVEDERFDGPYRFWIHTVPKAYAAVTADFLHLTPEAGWYPRAGVPPGAAFPAAGHRDYTRYEVEVAVPEGRTAFSQGAAQVDSASGVWRFRSDHPLPQVSLTIGRYAVRQVEVDEVTYTLAIHPGHDYFDAYLDSVAPALPELIRELRNEYEVALGLEYPHPRLSLVEVPIQFFAYERLWTVAQESVQPELVFLPEMGTLCDGADFRNQRRRSRYSQESANQAESAEFLQSEYLRTFVTLDLLGLQAPGFSQVGGNELLETRWKMLPQFVSYVTHVSSNRWPVLNQAFEAYFRERVAPPASTRFRRWTGLTQGELANLALKEAPLAEVLTDADLERGRREAVIAAKGRALLQQLAARVGAERFAREVSSLVAAGRYRGLSEEEVLAFAAGLGVKGPEELVEEWYRGRELPGYEVGKAEAYLVRDGERTRTQVELELANPTGVDGLVEVSFRYRQTETVPWWLRRGAQADYQQLVHLPAGTRKRLGVLVDRPVAELTVDTYVSRNIPSLITIPFQEQKLRRRARPFAGEEVLRLDEADGGPSGVYVVDNEDAGFAVHEAEQSNWLRRLLVDAFDLRERKVPYSGLRAHNAPGTWQPTTERRFHGQFVLSGYYKRAGDGRSVVSWRTEMERAGDYDIYFYCGPVDEMGHGRRRRGRWRNDNRLNLLVYHEGGAEPVELDVGQAEEGWNYLGTFHLSAGPAHVELTDRTTGRSVIADAIKWVERI